MSTMYKMIVPLLHKEITKDDIDPKKGFIGIYSKDTNRPYITDCIFLVYKFDTTENSFFRESKFAELGITKNKKLTYINGICYKVFAIPITNSDIKRLLKGLMVSSYDNKSRIIKFWNFDEGDINKIMFTPGSTFNYEESSIPEEDYMGEDENENGLRIPCGNLGPVFC